VKFASFFLFLILGCAREPAIHVYDDEGAFLARKDLQAFDSLNFDYLKVADRDSGDREESRLKNEWIEEFKNEDSSRLWVSTDWGKISICNDGLSVCNHGSSVILNRHKVAEAFLKNFGSLEGKALREFVSQRVHNFASSDFFYIRPENGRYTDWLRLIGFDEEGYGSLAYNEGMLFWLLGLLDNTTFFSVLFSGVKIMYDSPSSLVVLNFKNYQKLNRVVRQSVLIHESRHSDCNVNISPHDLQMIRMAPSFEYWRSRWDKPSCGYFHSVCHMKVSLMNVAQCDAVADGPFGLQSLFLAAMILNPRLDSMTKNILLKSFYELFSRIEIP